MSGLVGRKAHGYPPWKIGATVGIIQMMDEPKSKDGQANRLTIKFTHEPLGKDHGIAELVLCSRVRY